ncbi:MAG: DUF3472 domain-containing protein [Clostridia bacterium]|nr:DUF3472 domain-containing protein [Clostridia bacterium]
MFTEKSFIKPGLSILLLLVLIALVLPARAEDNLNAEGRLAVYDRNSEKRLRTLPSTSASLDEIASNEYISFEFALHSSKRVAIKSLYARINDGEKLAWSAFTIEAGSTVNCHIYHMHMLRLEPGTYRVTFYVNEQIVTTSYLTLTSGKLWRSAMNMPAQSEASRTDLKKRSPYIVCYPDFKGLDGYTQYAVDFKTDHQPKGTYLCCANFNLYSDSFQKQYSKVYNDCDYSGKMLAYSGFQVIYDGTKVAIMSVWNLYYTDKSGHSGVIRPELVYSSDLYDEYEFDGEGTGYHCSVRYDWQKGHSYRTLLQLGYSSQTGTDHLSMWVCDLENGQRWKLLMEYDLKIAGARMLNACAFLENYMPSTAPEVRSMELTNFRAYSRSGRWVSTAKATFTTSYDYPGSFNYGANGNSFWAITCGLPGRCVNPQKNKAFTAAYCESGSPF